MKYLWAGLLLAVTLSGAEREGQLTLRNGDRFRGALQGMQGGKELAWTHSEVSGVLKVDSKAIARAN